MAWRIEISGSAKKQLSRLGHPVRMDILRFLRDRLATDEDPRRFGDPLRKNLHGLWKYRVGSYRIICKIEDGRVTVLVLRVGHRRDVYELAN